MNKRFALCSLILVAGVLVVTLRHDHAPRAVDERPEVVLPTNTTGDAIYVADQRPVRDLADTMATLSRPGFVAIGTYHEGIMGDIIAASDVLAVGRTENFPLSLPQKAKDGETLYAMLYEDSDADSAFTNGKDQPLLDAAGSKVYVIFSVME